VPLRSGADLDFDGAISAVGPAEVILHLLGMLGMISRSWSNQAGFPLAEIRTGWLMALGTPDERT
jgi:hypothetical protein